MEIVGYILSILVGISLGLIGSGGSILTVPILVYIMGIDAQLSTAYSLFVVGTTALVGGLQYAYQKKVDFKTLLIFGLPSIASVYFTRKVILPAIPNTIATLGSFEFTKNVMLMLLFSVVMILASYSMIKPQKNNAPIPKGSIKYNFPLIFLEGTMVGILTGLVGAGGGFLIIPALVLLAKMPMNFAVGTSLMIIAVKSLFGFVGDIQNNPNLIDWNFLLLFTLFSVVGIFIGNILAKKIPNQKLKVGFGYFVLIMGLYIIAKELFF